MGRAISRATLAATLAISALVLASCGEEPGGKIRNIQWQVTQFSTGGTVENVDSRSIDIPTSMAGRVFLVLNQDSLRGASGCVDVMGKISWDGDTFHTETITPKPNTGAQCMPGDEDTANRLAEALTRQTFKWSESAENSLRLEADQGDETHLSTPPFIELVTN